MLYRGIDRIGGCPRSITRVEHRLRSIQFKIQAPSLQQARIVCEISLEGRKQAQTIINLPLPIIQDYLRWQVAYRKLDPRLRRSPVGNGMEPSPEQINQCLTATDELMEKFQVGIRVPSGNLFRLSFNVGYRSKPQLKSPLIVIY